MLDFAAAQPGAERVNWQQADATALPFPDRSFNIVACQFGAMFFPDKVAGYREALRVLRPAGRLVFSGDRSERSELRRCPPSDDCFVPAGQARGSSQ